ncbi:DNA polymerase I [Gemelliphila asaccharolytica]|uniref:DNA polymerase I n=1 Tax=Gemelliphila asaccharolytica TaxID=502393 RepID=A0ABR5TNQ4_9BACL|nr:DNA polymerase I [Gemella asaccharolytica]KXB58844.1 DNA-directed DNA polymerase [Gemella asaccharolytica]
MSKIILLDGNSLSYRAFYAMPPFKNKNGLYTNSVYGFVLMLDKILREVNPDYALVAFDKGKKTFRHKEYSEYKGTREKTPLELIEQFGYIRQLLDSYGIKYEENDEYEADDILGSYAKKASKLGNEVIIVTGDRDLTQLADEKITIYFTKKGVTEIEKYTLEFIKEKYNLNPKQIVDMKGLMGDKSDNIPGIAGVGEKTALKLLEEFETVENVLANIDKVSGKKLKEKLINGKQDAILSKNLATIYTDVKLENEIEDLTFNENIEKKEQLFKKLGFTSFLKKLSNNKNKTESINEKIEILKANRYTKIRIQSAVIYIENLTEDYHNSVVVGACLYTNKRLYIFDLEEFFLNKNIKEYLESKEEKNIYDFKKVSFLAKKYNIEIEENVFDAKIASYLIDVNVKAQLDKIVNTYLGELLESDEEIYGKGKKRKLPDREKINSYLLKIVTSLSKLEEILQKLLKKQNIIDLYKIEIKTSKTLANMEYNGIFVEEKALLKISEELEKRIKTLENSIYTLSGEEFNINSPKQLGEILFDKLQLRVIKKTKTGYSTSSEVLEQLKEESPIIKLIMEYRMLAKLNSTYAKGLIKDITKEGKIHTRYEQTLAQTGRLSSVNPNLQNIPIKIEEGKKIRKAFIPESKDNIILSIDYSQIELRILAHIANDEKMIEAFNNDLDIHKKTASEVNNVPIEEVTPKMRSEAKAVNFGIVYGISDFGLSNNLGISRKRAKEFIDKYLNTFSGVKKYMEDIVEFAKEHEYVETIFKRRRYIPEINSKNKILKNLNSRIAMNTPVQGSAADIIKIAMNKVYEYLKNSNIRAKMLLQIHDELIFDVHKDDRKILEKEVKKIMENVADLKVKLKASVSYGDNWYEAK